MTRPARAKVRTAPGRYGVLLASVVLVMLLGTPAAAARSAPSAPTVQGARTVTGVVRLRFAAHEQGLAPSRLRFRCSLDGSAFEPCGRSYRARLSAGSHTLRVRAVDPAGRAGPVTRVRIVVRPAGPHVTSVRTGAMTQYVAFGGGAVWATAAGGAVTRIDPATGRVVATIRVGGHPSGPAFGDGALWVANFDLAEVERIDPATNGVTRVPVGGNPTGVTVADDGTVWVANFDGSVERIDPASHTVGRTVTGGMAQLVRVAFGLVWSTNHDGTVATIDPATGRLAGAPIRVDPNVDGIAPTGEGVWVSTFDSGTVALIDPRTRRIVRRTRLPGQSGGLAFDGRWLWASVYRGNAVVRIDPATATITKTIHVGSLPRDLVAAEGSLWVANEGSGTVSRVPLG